jgi:hypothetical protein
MILPKELQELNKRDNFWLKQSLMKAEYVKDKFRLTIKESSISISNHFKELFPNLSRSIATAVQTTFCIGEIEYVLFSWDSSQKGILVKKLVSNETSYIVNAPFKCFLEEIGQIMYYWNDKETNSLYNYFMGISLSATEKFEAPFTYDNQALTIDTTYEVLVNSLRIISDDGGGALLTYSYNDNHVYAVNIMDDTDFEYLTGIYDDEDLIFSISKSTKYKSIIELLDAIFE